MKNISLHEVSAKIATVVKRKEDLKSYCQMVSSSGTVAEDAAEQMNKIIKKNDDLFGKMVEDKEKLVCTHSEYQKALDAGLLHLFKKK